MNSKTIYIHTYIHMDIHAYKLLFIYRYIHYLYCFYWYVSVNSALRKPTTGSSLSYTQGQYLVDGVMQQSSSQCLRIDGDYRFQVDLLATYLVTHVTLHFLSRYTYSGRLGEICVSYRFDPIKLNYVRSPSNWLKA